MKEFLPSRYYEDRERSERKVSFFTAPFAAGPSGRKKALLGTAVAAFAGGAAFLGSADTLTGLLPVGYGGFDAADEFERKLFVKEEDVDISESDRGLQVSIQAMQEGLYSLVGDGGCADYLGNFYDHATYKANSLGACARRCSRSILLDEHRGFEYNPEKSSLNCNCLFDDGTTPQPVWKKADAYGVEETDAEGEVQFSSSTEARHANFKCYKTESANLGFVMDPYQLEDCGASDKGTLDIFVFSQGVNTAEKCARKCNRFKMMDTYLGMTVTKDEGKCVCLFVDGEVPTKRKLGASRGARSKEITHEARYAAFLAPPKDAECYKKTSSGLSASAPEAERIQPDASNRVFINEFHIRNINVNTPWMRVIGPKGTSADGYKIQSIMGRNGGVHTEYALTGTFTSDDNAEWGSVTTPTLESGFTMNGKSGSDGLALIGPGDTCVQFFSYAHVTSLVRSFKASEGPCAGVGSVPINVMEARDVDPGVSIQLVGTGNKYDDFAFDGPFPKSTGTANAGQTLSSP